MRRGCERKAGVGRAVIVEDHADYDLCEMISSDFGNTRGSVKPISAILLLIREF